MFNPVITMFMAFLVAIAGGSVAYIYYGSYSLVAVGMLTVITLLPVLVLCYFKVYRRYGATLTAYILAVIAGAVNLVSFVLILAERVTGEVVSHSIFVPVALAFSSALILTGYTVYAAFAYSKEKVDVGKMWRELPKNFYEQPKAEPEAVAEEYVEVEDGAEPVAEDMVEPTEDPIEETLPNPVEEPLPNPGTEYYEVVQNEDHNDLHVSKDTQESVYRQSVNLTEAVDYKPKEFDSIFRTGTDEHSKALRGIDADEVSAAPKWKVVPARAAEPETQDNVMFMPQRDSKPRRGL